MIPLPLEIGATDAHVRPPVAWFLSGNAPQRWVRELTAWGIPLRTLKLYVIPRSLNDRVPCGVLVVPPAGETPRASARAHPYGVFARRLFLPVDAVLSPPVSEAELDAKLVGDTLVLHPLAGLVGFAASDAIGVKDVLETPTQRSAAWDRAHPGVVTSGRLLSVEPESEPNVEQIIDSGRQDIGTEPLEQVPESASPEEGRPGSLLRRAQDWGRRSIGRGILALTRLAPQWASEPTWVNRLETWAQGLLTALGSGRKPRTAGESKLWRLLDLLRSDPDEGLRYALPLGPNAGRRGVAPGGGDLPRRDPEFDLGRLGGGGPTAYWEVQERLYRELVQRYREVALLEMRLGRYRRAAYIYAELLEDYHAAAAALKTGGHYREAAVLYRDKLGRPLDAASCLKEGGLLTEAAKIYEDHGVYEEAGDLYGRLEQADEAERCYRLAVKDHRARDDLLAAGRILEEKLEQQNEALKTYDSGWPSSRQAKSCLLRQFRLCGRVGWHGEARGRLQALRRRPLPASRAVLLAEVLADVAASYPDRQVRDQSADTARVVAGTRLADASFEQTEQLVRALTRLVPEDRLLPRDGHRFCLRRWGLRGSGPPVAGEFRLPSSVAWQVATAEGGILYAAGYTGDGLVLVRCRWDGHYQVLKFRRRRPHPSFPILLAAPRNPADPVILAPLGQARFRPLEFPRSDTLPTTEAGTPFWLPDDTMGIAHGEDRLVWVAHHDANGIALSEYGLHGSPVAGHVFCWRDLYPPELRTFLDSDEPQPSFKEQGPLPVLARWRQAFVAHQTCLLAVETNGRSRTVRFERTILDLAGTGAHSKPYVAVNFSEGGALLSPRRLAHPISVGEGLRHARAAFTQAGTLIFVSAEEGRAYHVDDRNVVAVRTLEGSGSPPLAVLPAAGRHGYAVVTRDGTVRLSTAAGMPGD